MVRNRFEAYKARTACLLFAPTLEGGYDIRTVQELLGHSDVKTTMIDTHVLNRNCIRRITGVVSGLGTDVPQVMRSNLIIVSAPIHYIGGLDQSNLRKN